MKDTIEIELKAIDFKDTDFIGRKGMCAIEKAVVRQLNAKKVHEVLSITEIDGEDFDHEFYGCSEFVEDFSLAKAVEFSPEKTIRTITLTKY